MCLRGGDRRLKERVVDRDRLNHEIFIVSQLLFVMRFLANARYELDDDAEKSMLSQRLEKGLAFCHT